MGTDRLTSAAALAIVAAAAAPSPPPPLPAAAATATAAGIIAVWRPPVHGVRRSPPPPPPQPTPLLLLCATGSAAAVAVVEVPQRASLAVVFPPWHLRWLSGGRQVGRAGGRSDGHAA